MAKRDHIKINGLRLNTFLTDGPWSTGSTAPRAQPVIISLAIIHDITSAAATDDYTKSIDYSSVCNTVQQICSFDPGTSGPSSCPSVEDLAEKIAKACLTGAVQETTVEVNLPRAIFRAKGSGIAIRRRRDGRNAAADRLFVKGLQLFVLIGAREHERSEKQPVLVDLDIERPAAPPGSQKLGSSATLARHISEVRACGIACPSIFTAVVGNRAVRVLFLRGVRHGRGAGVPEVPGP